MGAERAENRRLDRQRCVSDVQRSVPRSCRHDDLPVVDDTSLGPLLVCVVLMRAEPVGSKHTFTVSEA